MNRDEQGSFDKIVSQEKEHDFLSSMEPPPWLLLHSSPTDETLEQQLAILQNTQAPLVERIRVIRVLAQRTEQEVRAAIFTLLVKKDQDITILSAAIQAVKTWGEQVPIDVLQSLLEHRAWQVRETVVETLAQLPSLPTRVLTSALYDANKFVYQAAIRALDDRLPLEILFLNLRKRGDVQLRVKTARLLGEVQRRQVVGHLLQALQDEDAGVRREALLSLSRLPYALPVASLLAAQQDSDQSVKEAASLVLYNLYPSYHLNTQIPYEQRGDYVLLTPLSKEAKTYIGYHRQDPRTELAIKTFDAQLVTQQEREEFIKEASLIASLYHPSIVQIQDFGIQEEQPFVVMDYIVGGTIRALINSVETVSLARVTHFVVQIAGALRYAHEREVIHGDIKPENILLKDDNTVLLSDFTLWTVAKRINHHSGSNRSEAHKRFSNTFYMPPETQHNVSTFASDQYALAVVTYELLTKEPPFPYGHKRTGVYQETPPSLHQKMPEIPPAVDQVLNIALAEAAEARYPTVKDFAEAFLQASQSNTFITPEHNTFVRRSRLSQQHAIVKLLRNILRFLRNLSLD